ncbi:ATP-binding cassette domain-containing protein [Saccharopolyspora sp. 5N102]|uniref:ATP-binding cassette domain-containing protein n=1 Tax=Saccharopolyspora sp. 5N102 TaxID=3375155 RepID=UPI0037B210E9
MTPTIESAGLTKKFGSTTALDGLDLVAEPGRVVALLGPNGAGKTTFVRLVATLLRPDSGTLRIAGFDVVAQPQKVRQVIGLAGQYAAVEEVLTGRENLEMVARLFGQSRRDARTSSAAVLEQLGLVDHADRRVKDYSGGLRRRLDLGASLVAAPRVLLLDEPTTGLDPRSRVELWAIIRRLVQQGTDVLLTTQYLNEADELADEIAVVDHGRVIASGSPRELKDRFGQSVIEVHLADAGTLDQVGRLLAALGTSAPHVDGADRFVSVQVNDGARQLRETVQLLTQHDIPAEEISLRRPSLDEIFLALTGSPSSVDGDDPERSSAAAGPGKEAT